jgi:periplasmic protein TonB
MSKFSIYSKAWIDLVFEDRNQDYGAFQLRQKSDETTLLAFCLGLAFIATLFTIPMLISSFRPNSENEITTPICNYPVIHISNYKPNPPQKPIKSVLPITKKEPTEIDKKQTLVSPEIVKPIDANQDIATTLGNTIKPNTENNSKENGTNPSPNSEIGKGKTIPIAPEIEETINTTITLDKLPEFPGGLNVLYSYIGEKFENLEVEETVTVHLSFVVEKDGSMTDIKVVRSATPSVDREAIRVLKSLRTKWKPGIKNGQSVRTLYRIPIKVKK